MKFYLAPLFAVFVILTSLVACAPRVDFRGYVFEEERLEQIRVGGNRAEVEALLGVPSAQSPIDNRTIYYIYSHYETETLFAPKEKERRILAVAFDTSNKVSEIKNYGLEEAIALSYETDITRTQGNQLSVIQQIFGNFGRFGAGVPAP